eukprot:jgi/Picsp_1/5405/NSC_02765-R1_mate efflux family protein
MSSSDLNLRLLIPSPFESGEAYSLGADSGTICDNDISLISVLSGCGVNELTGRGGLSGTGACATSENDPKTIPFRKLLRLTIPLSSANVVFFIINLVNIAFVGKLGKFELAVSVLALSVYNIIGLATVMGNNTALEPLCGQAYGAKKYKLVGIYTQRSIILNGVLSVVIMAMWFSFGEWGFLHLTRDSNVAKAASRFLILVSPSLPFNAVFESLKRYLSCQGILRPVTMTSLICLLICPFYNWLFISRMELGLDGAALTHVSLSASMTIMLFIMTCVIEWCKRSMDGAAVTWHGWSLDAFKGYFEFLSLAVPGFVMLVSEWLTFEILVILSSFLPDDAQLAMSTTGILLNISGLIWTLVNGISTAASILISTSLGAGYPVQSKSCAAGAVRFGLIVEAVAIMVLYFGRHSLGILFTNNKEVIQAISCAIPFFVMTLPGDGITICLQAVLRGTGKLSYGAIVNMCSYWLIGIPSAYYFAFWLDYGIRGLWIGIAIVNTFLAIVMTLIVRRIDFFKEADLAIQRISNSS